MKIKALFLVLLLTGCTFINVSTSTNDNSVFSSSIYQTSSIDNLDSSSIINSTTSNDSSSIISTSTSSTSSKPSSESSSLSSNNSSSSSASKSSSSTSSAFNVCEDKPGGKNEDGSDKLPIPCNKNNKLEIGNDNKTMTSFSFYDSLPNNFRAIYGNIFNTGASLFYSTSSGGGYMVKMGGPDDPCRGIQTAMFESNLKLEIRVNIGQMNNNSKGNNVDKDLPVMVIYAFDENGKYLRKAEVEEITKNNENGTIKRYIDGTDVAYLEIRSLQCAYKSSQGYNYAILGLDLIAWPYPL